MPTPSFDFAAPYELMVGVWDGLSSVYTAEEKFLGSWASRVVIYWKEPGKVLCFRQVQQSAPIAFDVGNDEHVATMDQLRTRDEFHVDFHIDGKRGRGRSEVDGRQYEGFETTPGTYLFHIRTPKGCFYNNQFFPNPNERRIIGPLVENGTMNVLLVLSQVFARISYDVPEAYRVDDDHAHGA